MPVYVMGSIEITDRERYRDYEAGFMAVFDRFNGQVLAADDCPVQLEGERPTARKVLIRFPDESSARAWYDSDEYQALKDLRLHASNGEVVMVTGLQ